MEGTLDKIKSIQSSPLIPFLVPLIIITLIIIGMYVKLGDKGHILNLLIISSIASGIILVMKGPQMNIIIPLLFIFLIFTYVSLITIYKESYGNYRSQPDSINQLLSLRRTQVGNNIDPLPPNNTSVAMAIMNKKSPYVAPKINSSNISLLQWAPLTVRLAGYLGGDVDSSNGVFDMLKATQVALSLGARSFVFDIDYLDARPCEPRLIYRDGGGFMRSLHTGSISEGMDSLNKMAFKENYDPVIIVLYLRRIPGGKSQKEAYFSAIASSLHPLSTYHLGLTEQGNFHGCNNEKGLFFGDITHYQKKFIVLCNYDTTLLQRTSNPKDNLNFWVNARLYLHEASTSSSLGSVTKKIGTGGIAYAKVGDINDFLTIPGSSTTAVDDFQQGSMVAYTIALTPIDYTITTGKINILLNTLGVHSITLDVIRLGEHKNHNDTIKNMKPISNITMADITTATNGADPLSFWTYAGWSRFKTDDKENTASAANPSS
jgi:hypothetical protein